MTSRYLEIRVQELEAEVEKLREALNDAANALRDIAESSPNWMVADAIGEHSHWCNEFARQAQEKAEAALGVPLPEELRHG